MPQVPSYEANRVPLEVGRPNFARNNFDAGPAIRAGQALTKVGDTVLDIGLQEQKKVDDTQVLGGNRGLSQFEIDRLHNPETGALTRRGKDAIDAQTNVLTEYDKARAKLEEGMNARAKARFALLADQRRLQIQEQLAKHVASESDKLNLAETEANEAGSLREVAVKYKDPEAIAVASDLGWAGRYARMQREGKPPEAIKEARLQWDADIKGTILDQMLANRDPLAAEFFKQNRTALGTKADEYTKQVDQLQLQIDETRETDRILGQFGSGPAAIAEARNITDPVLRERVETRIDREQVRLDRARTAEDKAIRDYAWNVAGSLPVGASLESVLTPRQIVAINQVPGLRAELDRETDSRLKGTETKTVPAVYERLQTMDPAEFAKEDLSKYNGQLAPGDRDYFAKRQKEAQDPNKQAQYATENQQLDIVYGDLGIPAGTKGAAKRTEFDKAYREDLRVWVANNKREPTAEERQKIMDGLTLPFVRKGRLWGQDTVPAYKLDPSKPESMKRVTIPDDARAQIIARRAAQGKPPLTEEQLMRVYVQWKGAQ